MPDASRSSPGPTFRAPAPSSKHWASSTRRRSKLQGKRATVQAVLEALAESDLVHLAAHGSFRRDNPLFSTLRLADGPLTVYDLERVQAAPRSMVLSACSAATALVMPGDELVGTAVALLHIGAASVVGPVDVVDDSLTGALMVDLHRALVGGAPMGAALMSARVAAADRGARAWANAVLFACLGI